MSDARHHHKDWCSCQNCTYDRARIARRLPMPSVKRVQDEPSYRPGLYLALDEIAETVAVYASDFMEAPRETTRREAERAECDHWNARRMVVCPDCGDDWEECE